MKNNATENNRRTGIPAIALALALAASAPSCSSLDSFNPFGGGSKKPSPAAQKTTRGAAPGESKAARLRATRNKAAKAGEPGAATETIDPVEASFKKELGREDPFDAVPVKENAGDMKKQVESFPELYRVIGTAKTPQGPVAMLQMNTDSPIVHVGDILDSGAKVKQINTYSVVLDSAGMEITLVMRTRKREAPAADQAAGPGMDAKKLVDVLGNISKIGNNVDELYDAYLKQKYNDKQQKMVNEGETGQGETSSGSAEKPTTFNDFMNRK